ncbi:MULTISPECIES: helix-hairpin-helix domain-containing protein [unclassified Exiguobacterium]|uniref:helix-hairpin-helix domain-containing protein n=1 Tax=unclassified Exiguobacterium TaxID=2644629 RepID=UPI001BEAD511|nr:MULTISPECIES: helix-hairpin-helix domain-containing protein [unclassified Exiguobacterium]MDX1259765.1 helix-hairpin-helix domain-containing protein [Exiguobacterium sp. K1]
MTIPRLQQVATITVVLLLLVVLFVPLPSCSNEALVEKPAVVEREQEAQAEDRSADQTLVQKKIMVDIKGAVKRPGPYSFRLGDRVQDAIKRAEVTAEADIKQLNLAARLIDGQEVIVPTRKKAKSSKKAAPETSEQAEIPKGLLDLNAATEEQLLEVPGIGPAKAGAILQYREEKGGFATYENLGDVKGFGPKTLENLKAYLIVY